MKKNIFLLFFFLFAIFSQIYAQIPSGYYNSVDGKKGKEMQITLSQIIKGHRNVTYPEVWIYYQYTDVKQSGKIWDIYSDIPQGVPKYEYTYRTDQCASIGNKEGVCYTREHAFCQSWFGKTQEPPYTDIFHLYPTDGWINTKRNDNPYGVVTNPTDTTTNGSKIGLNTYEGSLKVTCFEPIKEYKGDIARSFFYMATRYMFEDEKFKAESPMTFKSQLKPWALKMLMEWHELDPVSDKERERNNKIYAIQKNRNPFIDHPEWVAKIWRDSLTPVSITQNPTPEKPRINWFELTDNRTLKMTFTKPMIAWTTENPLNYEIGSTVSINSLHLTNDTLILRLGGLFSQNVTYNLKIENLLAQNMAFLNDTMVSFYYPYNVQQKAILAWTFDKIDLTKPITADLNILDTVSSAILYFDGTYQSSIWVSSELNSFTGTTLGDPRANPKAEKAIAFVSNTANGKSAVFKFPTREYFNLSLSMAVQRSNTGFDSHEWEWSLDGEHYTPIENANTCPLTAGSFILTTLDLRDIDDLSNQDEVFLRLTFFGCTHPTGNNRLDNITINGVSIHESSIDSQKKNDKTFLIVPNPTSGRFQIVIHNIDNLNNICYTIYNFCGQEIQTGNLNQPIIDISAQPNGIYFCRIFGEVLKIVKY